MSIARPTVTVVGSPRVEPKPCETQVLFEEAQRRRRRRRLWTMAAVLTVNTVVVAGLTFTGSSGGPRPRAVTSTKPSVRPPVAADAWITGFAEPCCGAWNSPVQLEVIATHGTREITAAWFESHETNGVAHDVIVANASNRWRPTYRLRVSPGVYRLSSFDGGIVMSPLLVDTKLVTVGTTGKTQDLPCCNYFGGIRPTTHGLPSP
jgi:hypothetical protein